MGAYSAMPNYRIDRTNSNSDKSLEQALVHKGTSRKIIVDGVRITTKSKLVTVSK